MYIRQTVFFKKTGERVVPNPPGVKSMPPTAARFSTKRIQCSFCSSTTGMGWGIGLSAEQICDDVRGAVGCCTRRQKPSNSR